jgi:hypothetical protein
LGVEALEPPPRRMIRQHGQRLIPQPPQSSCTKQQEGLSL